MTRSDDSPIAEHGDRSECISVLTTRAWRDPGFRELLFADADTAMRMAFGRIPAVLEGVTFAPRPVDRVRVRQTERGRQLIVRPKRQDQLISAVVRTVANVAELVVVFYTKRCRYQCSFCTLPSTSSYTVVDTADLLKQLDDALALAGAHGVAVERVSLGNEGSILDEGTVTAAQLNEVIRRCVTVPSVQQIVLETRAEFVERRRLRELRGLMPDCRLKLKIGLESASDDVREGVLHKKMDLRLFEAAVQTMGEEGIDLSSYVLLKASPWHTDAEGRADALDTCAYLKALAERASVGLELRINAMYKAGGSKWAQWADTAGWESPSVFDLAEVMDAVAEPGTFVYAGLSEEGLATRDGHYEVRADYLPWAREMLEAYNETGDLALLREVATYRSRQPRPAGNRSGPLAASSTVTCAPSARSARRRGSRSVGPPRRRSCDRRVRASPR